MAARGLLLAVTLLSSMVAACYAQVMLSGLPVTLKVASTPPKADLKAGEGKITVTWELNQTSADTSKYGKVVVKLCYRKESQIDRPWRKTSDELFKDKTCQHDVAAKAYAATANSAEYTVLKDVPTGHYFIRAYVNDAAGNKVAYGEDKTIDLSITAITGRHASIDIAAGIFSAFSVVSLAFFFYLEKKSNKGT